jgi:hypothetical protein
MLKVRSVRGERDSGLLLVLDCVLESWLISTTRLQRVCRVSGRSVGDYAYTGGVQPSRILRDVRNAEPSRP